LKKTLTFLILTILMLSAFAVIFAQNVKASDTSGTEVKVLSYTWYTSTSSVNAGDLIAVGEIQNVGTKTISNVTLTGNAFGLNGEALATTQAQAFVYDMLPGQKAPFYIDFSQSNGIQNPQASGSSTTTSWVTSVSDVSVTVASVTDTSATQYLQLQIPKGASMLYPPSEYPSNEYTLTGYIQNNGTKPAENVFAVVTFYNSTGAAVAMNFTSILSSSLAPGAEVSFFATPVDPTDTDLLFNITSYAVLIDSYTPGSGSTSTSGSQTSSPINSTTQFTLYVVVIVVVIVAVIVALMLLRKRQKLPTPPPPPPPASPEMPPPQETP